MYPLDISLYSRTTGEKIQPRSGYSVKITLPVPAKLIDVREGVWYYSAVRFVAQNGLMNGTGKNTFSPQAAANRGMIVAILHKLSGSEETLQSSFRDVVSGAYYAKGVAWAQKNDIVAGYGNGLFGPEDSITREQMITILWKFAGLPAADTTSLVVFKDAGEISPYAGYAMAWAYESGIIAGKGSGIVDPKGIVTRAETAKILESYLNSR